MRMPCLLAILLASASGVPAPGSASAHATAPAPLTSAQWQEDLDVLASRIEARHKDAFHSVRRDDFLAAVDDLRARIPGMRRHEIIVGFMRLAASIGDGHTNVSPLKEEAIGFHELPLRLYLFEDGLYVRAATPEFAHLVGARVVAFDGVAVDEALRRVADVSPRDNAMGLRFHAPVFLGMTEILHALGLAPDPAMARMTVVRDGRDHVVDVPAHAVSAKWPPDTDISLVTPEGYVDGRAGPPPTWLQAPLDYHRLVALPDDDALYVQLNMVTGIDGQSLEQFGDRIVDAVARGNPRAVVLDLRLNRGGNQDLRFPFVADLIRVEDADTRLFVLVARGAFSATQKLIGDLALYTDAVLVGEPAGSKPDAYGDSYREVLPNSGITLRVSTRWHQGEGQGGPWTPIDVWTPLDYADDVASHDPALAAALGHVPEDPLWQRVLALPDDAVAGTAQVHVDVPARRYADRAGDLLQASLRLFSSGRPEASLAVADLGTRRFPDDPRLWTMVAYGSHATGDPAAATAAARQVVRLDPDNRDVRRFLAED